MHSGLGRFLLAMAGLLTVAFLAAALSGPTVAHGPLTLTHASPSLLIFGLPLAGRLRRKPSEDSPDAAAPPSSFSLHQDGTRGPRFHFSPTAEERGTPRGRRGSPSTWLSEVVPLSLEPPIDLSAGRRRTIETIQRVVREEASAVKAAGTHPHQFTGTFLPSPVARVVEGFTRVGLDSRQVVLDLGHGHGELLFVLARLFGVRGIGLEAHDERCDVSRRVRAILAQRRLLRPGQVQLLHTDFLDRTWKDADVLYYYSFGAPASTIAPMMRKAREELRPGARLVVLGDRVEREHHYDDFRPLCEGGVFSLARDPSHGLWVFTRTPIGSEGGQAMGVFLHEEGIAPGRLRGGVHFAPGEPDPLPLSGTSHGSPTRRGFLRTVATLALGVCAGCTSVGRAQGQPSVITLQRSPDGHRWFIDGKTALPPKGVVYQPTGARLPRGRPSRYPDQPIPPAI